MVISVSLGAAPIEYSEIDFLSLPPHPLPYLIMKDGFVLRCNVSNPRGAWHPVDRRYFNASVQTEDADTTLTDITPDDLASIPDDNDKSKKRKRE
ncbi:hypothetical protein EI94DRAFT_1793749 [Lactarius quietus]|nr:hypothetical protein EI94DRAFT_1793749 [Lactarius quietus]